VNPYGHFRRSNFHALRSLPTRDIWVVLSDITEISKFFICHELCCPRFRVPSTLKRCSFRNLMTVVRLWIDASRGRCVPTIPQQGIEKYTSIIHPSGLRTHNSHNRWVIRALRSTLAARLRQIHFANWHAEFRRVGVATGYGLDDRRGVKRSESH
jgi:hypothetical protein